MLLGGKVACEVRSFTACLERARRRAVADGIRSLRCVLLTRRVGTHESNLHASEFQLLRPISSSCSSFSVPHPLAALSSPHQTPDSLPSLPSPRTLAAWAVVGLFAWALQPLAGVLLGSFVLCVLCHKVVSAVLPQPWLPQRLRSRRVAVLLFFSALLLPPLWLLSQYLSAVPVLPQHLAELQRQFQVFLSDSATTWQPYLSLLAASASVSSSAPASELPLTAERLLAYLLAALRPRLLATLQQAAATAPAVLATAAASASSFLLQSLLSVILSFLLMWDLASLGAGVASLRRSPLSFLVEEVGPLASEFTVVFGQAMAAQSLVALLNTFLTLLCLLLIQTQPSMLLPLSSIVFLCSFIPVAGVVMSSVPVAGVALVERIGDCPLRHTSSCFGPPKFGDPSQCAVVHLFVQAHPPCLSAASSPASVSGGLLKALLAIALILFIHAVEAYVLNPFIYSSQLKLHPAATLVVLVLAEHSFGVWGLLAAVPCTAFLLRRLLQPPTPSGPSAPQPLQGQGPATAEHMQ